jgi:hypothetical protein
MRSRSVKTFALSLLLVSMLSVPAMAAIDRDSGVGHDLPGFGRIVQIAKFVFKAIAMGDTLSVPKP